MQPFGARLRAAMDSRGPLCVGIDPHPYLLSAWRLDDNPAGVERFALTCVEALAGSVAVLKPQSAFFERHGSAGIAALERTIGAARAAGTLVLADVKRGDIGSTMRGYAEAYLDQSAPLAVDAVTLSPYLGFESLRPALDIAAAQGAGVFVLAATSNPESVQVQNAIDDGQPVSSRILAAVARENHQALPMGSVGAVVGATCVDASVPSNLNGPILAPGIGAQGGTADAIRQTVGQQAHLVLAAASRSVLQQGPDPTALRHAAAAMCADVHAALVPPT